MSRGRVRASLRLNAAHSAPRRPALMVLVLALVMVAPWSGVHAQETIRLRTIMGDLFVTLTPDAAPQTVANFLDYLSSGDYESTFFHQSLPGGDGTGQLIAAGKFSWPENSPTGITRVREGSPVVNEFNQSNRRGTIAMLAPEGLPDGATNTWFINVADNGAVDSGGLDSLNGGAAVFGTINAAGMEIVDAIAAECVEDRGVDFPDLPVVGVSSGDLRRDQLILISETTEFPVIQSPVSAILPGSRSVASGEIATAYATIVNPANEIAASCRIKPITDVPATFEYYQTDPLTNLPLGAPNPQLDIAANGFATLVFSFTPLNLFPLTDIEFDFSCGNAESGAQQIIGVNSFQLAALGIPGADVVAIVATAGNTGTADIGLASGAGAFAVATTNVGAAETITVSADTGTAELPVTLLVCESDPATGACFAPPASSVESAMAADATATFSVFVQLTEVDAVVAFDPAGSRAFVRFANSAGDVRGSTSVALRTVPPG